MTIILKKQWVGIGTSKRLRGFSWVLLLSVMIMGTVATAAKPSAPQSNVRPALSVEIVTPQSMMLEDRIVANGNVAAWQEVSVTTEVGGLRLTELLVNVGDVVKQGQVLALFDNETVQIELKQAQASVAEAKAALTEANANAKRVDELQDTGALSQQQSEQFLAAAQSAKARFESAQAQQATQVLRLKRSKVVAPYAGTITGRPALLGAAVAAGNELFRLIRNDRLEWRAEVTATELIRLHTGQAVQVQGSSGPPVEARLRMVGPTVDLSTRNATVYVDLPVAARQAGLRPGMFARGDFIIDRSSAMTLPATALTMRDGFNWVYVLRANNRIAERKVQTGRRVADRVEIVSGVAQEDRVVANGGAFLADGDTVRVVGK